jgi:hypothetical protein
LEKSIPIICATSVIFNKLDEENNRPMGEFFAQSGHPGPHQWYEIIQMKFSVNFEF